MKGDLFDRERWIFRPKYTFTSENRSAKVENVLCAKCVEARVFVNPFGDISSTSRRADEHREKLKSVLNAGYKDNLVPLPPMEKVLPNLIVDMKSLETVDIKRIAKGLEEYTSVPENYDYVRICSIDSPFKEQIVWAYLNNACRPGVPDRDMDWWINKINQ